MRDVQYWASLVHELCAMPHEASWVEFKHNNAEPQEIGEYISALANACALEGKAHAYLLWGVDDATHELLGTSFDSFSKRVGNEELENWLLRQVNGSALSASRAAPEAQQFHFACDLLCVGFQSGTVRLG
jgi:ATP-dependent DNA helicase RecG